jgi:hypothetical protein
MATRMTSSMRARKKHEDIRLARQTILYDTFLTLAKSSKCMVLRNSKFDAHAKI